MAWVVTAVSVAIELGTAVAIATAVTEVGIAMTVVGAVTGNKELTKVGGFLSLAGGIGSMAAGAGLFGEAAAGTVAGTGGEVVASELAPTVAAPDVGVFDKIESFAPQGNVVQQTLNANPLTSLDPALNSAMPQSFAGVGGPTVVQPLTPGSAASGMGGAATDAAGKIIGDGTAKAATEVIKSGMSTMDAAKAWLKDLPPVVQAELMKSVLAIPGGIQSQQNKERELGIQQQRVDQTSHTQVPHWGAQPIIATAKAQ